MGLHRGHSTMFERCSRDVALRLLGKPSSARVSKGEEMDHRSRWGDAGAVVGKFWLAVLGVYEWSGLNRCPGCWLLPYWLPVHRDDTGVTVAWFTFR